MQAQGCEASGARSAKPTDMRTPEATHREATVVTGGQWAEPGGTRPSGTANTRLHKPAQRRMGQPTRDYPSRVAPSLRDSEHL